MNDASFDYFEPPNPFRKCQSLAEILVVGRALGLDIAQLIEGAAPYRESLCEASDELRAVGLLDIAALCRKAARKAATKPRRLSVAESYMRQRLELQHGGKTSD